MRGATGGLSGYRTIPQHPDARRREARHRRSRRGRSHTRGAIRGDQHPQLREGAADPGHLQGAAPGRPRRRPGAAVQVQPLRHGPPDRLGSRAGRSDVPAHLPATRDVAAGALRPHRLAARARRGQRRAARGGERDPAHAEPAPRRPDGAQRAHAARQATDGHAAQVPRDGAVLPQPGADLPRLLHVLLPLAAVRRHGRPQVRDARRRVAARVRRGASRGQRHPLHRRRPADHEDAHPARLHRAAAGAGPRPEHLDDSHRLEGARLLAAAPDFRRRRRRAAGPVPPRRRLRAANWR